MRTCATETWTSASTLSHVLLSTFWDGWESITLNLPVGRRVSWATRGAACRVIASIALRIGCVGKSLHEGLEVWKLTDRVTADLDETIVAVFLRVFIDKTTRVDTSHVSAVERGNLLEFAFIGVAAILGQEEGETIASEVLDLLIPARSGEGGRITPRVIIESEEVGPLVRSTAIHVFGHLKSVLLDVCCRVADWDSSVTTVADVLTHIAGNSLDVGSALRAARVVDDFVAREECQCVVIISKSINGSKDVLQVDVIVRGIGICSIEGVERCVDVEDEVDASICQSTHARIVVGSVVDSIDTDGIDAQLLKFCNVSLAAGLIGNGISQIGGATRLVVDASNIETVVASEEGWKVLVVESIGN